ncbi:MAG: valine--tRNA ligase [Planctomycetes bacterium]|nr:valine--tRNA ligase [Planctomycetota bacterium]
MTLELPKSYDATAIESDVYQRWEDAGCFKAGAGKRAGMPPYAIAIPPPNVTGVLHMGHALNNTLQDTLVRWRRMQGYDTLWQPGTDHAGIATEAVVAKQLLDEGQTREALGRDGFIERVWAWKEQSGGIIVNQLRKLGSSCDWSRARFTMDEGLSQAVRIQFKNLYDQGLIYRGTRMVNWSPVLKTALSDDEVDMKEVDGVMWKLRYPLSDGSGEIHVETTRPETFFGDTAVAVNPTDERYRAMIGKTVRLPIVGRDIPIIADEHADPEKGTGAVKVTPAHDPNDYEIGLRHRLPLVRVIGFDGRMEAAAAHFAGQDRFACRKALLKELAASGVLLGETKITHAVGHSERSKEPIEPMVTEQWFVRMAPLAERALAETAAGRVTFHPDRWTKVYGHWLGNVRDWCISRQIWWGHRIPAWYCASCAKTTVSIADASACAHCGSADLRQDADVLDTWFSSALWPFSTLGWPEATPEMQRYFPTSTLVTDRGIIFFWVARMVMASLFALDKKPFSDVYIHGTVLDERGTKMSKSLGNGIDPLVMIQGGTQRYLGKDYQCVGYGADALRFTLLDMTTEGQDLKLNPTKFETGRNFANKVWNAGRFLLMNLSERPLAKPPTPAEVRACALGFEERWLLDRLQTAIADCTRALEAFRFNDYSNAGYRFFRDDLCDWYVEWAKRQFKLGGEPARTAGTVLWYALDQALRLLHPGMPFITEYLWQQLQTTAGGQTWAAFLMTSPFPAVDAAFQDAALAPEMDELQRVITAVRNIRNQQNLPDATKLAVILAAPDAQRVAHLSAHRDFLIDRGNLEGLTIAASAAKPATSVTEVVGDLKVHVALSGVIDLEKFKANITRQIAAKEKSIAGKRGRLDNAEYVRGAPPDQVQATRELLAREEVELANLRETLNGLVNA